MAIDDKTRAEVKRLYAAEQWRVGTIARQLHLHHSTVARIVHQRTQEASAHRQRPSMVDPYLPLLTETLSQYPTLSAARLYEMAKQRGYPGRSDSHFRTIIAKIRPPKPTVAYLRLHTLPGEQGQVDWARFGHITIGKAIRPLWAFVMVLSYSRRIFLRFYCDAQMPSFLSGHVEGFTDFGGVPRVLLYDNLKSAVLERRGPAIRFHPTLLALAAHYHFEPRPVGIARGNEKGRVERAIRYIRTGFFAGRTFVDLDDLNRQADRWRDASANQRPWPQDREQTVQQAFTEEQSTLLSLPDDVFPTHERCEVRVGKTPYVRFDKNDYSIPHTHTKKTLTVVATKETVTIEDGGVILCRHPRSYDKGKHIESPEHIEALRQEKRNAATHVGMYRLGALLPDSDRFLSQAAKRGYPLRGVVKQLECLLLRFDPPAVNRALIEALDRDVAHPNAVMLALDRACQEQHLAVKVPIALPKDSAAERLVVRPHSLTAYDHLKKSDEENTHDPD